MSKYVADVIIIGAGIAGNSAAYCAAKKGLKVIVLEKEIIGNGGSSRNGGGVRISGRDPREIPLALYAVNNIWPYVKDELGIDCEYERSGYMVCGYNEEHKKGIAQRVVDAAKFGIDMELLEGDAIKDRCKYVSDHVTVADWTPMDGIADPLKSTLAFYIRARELGVQFITGEKVIKLNLYKGQARQAVTERGDIYEGGKIIVSAGYYGRELLNTVGLDVPIRKRLIEVIITEPVRPLISHMIGGMSGFYGHQTKHGSFVFGDNSGKESFMAHINKEITMVGYVSTVCSHLGTDLPVLKDFKVVRTWAGLTDMCSDGVAIIGNVEEVPGLIINIGCSGHGFCTGPATGYVMAQLANDEKPAVDLSALSYERFDLGEK